MTSAGDGWFEVIADCGAGTRYRYLLEDGQAAPEPASRLQDHDVHGHSIVVDPASYQFSLAPRILRHDSGTRVLLRLGSPLFSAASSRRKPCSNNTLRKLHWGALTS